MNLLSYFNFHPVGQGCFYTGIIKFQNKEFSFIYDCGTLSKRQFLTNASETFIRPRNVIDMVIISHFDEDHVNGVFEILKKVRCKRLILPYYEPFERLIVYSSQDNDPGGDYLNFLIDPFNFFTTNSLFQI